MPTTSTPLTLRSGAALTPTVRLGSGSYTALDLGNIVSITASNISMSGLHAHAELVLISTFVPPMRYKLMVYETAPQLDNLITGSATAHFEAGGVDEAAGIVQIEDSTGVKDVPIQKI